VRNKALETLIKLAILVIVVLLLGGAEAIWHHSHVDHIAATITKTERVNYGETSKYLVWADVQDEQGTHSEVLEDVDAWYFIKWNSSDVYGQLKVGQTYRLKVSGTRFQLLSWYRNIVSIE
jgi:hypothetical protein